MISLKYVPLVGHKVTMNSVMAVLSEVNDLSCVAGTIGLPEELSQVIFSGRAEREEVVGRVSEYWLQRNPSWPQLREIVMSCNEHKALDINGMMEAYNHEGRDGRIHIGPFHI